MKNSHKFICITCVLFSFLSVNPLCAQDYEQTVLPIFAAKCYSCHGERVQQGGLRMDTRNAFMKGGLSGLVIVPGDSEKSLLFQLVTNVPPKKYMPLSGERLTEEEIEIVREWINAGAPWSGGPEPVHEKAASTPTEHWAFIPPQRPALPQVNNDDWVLNPIDVFILKGLEERKIKPSPEADRETLIRRLKLDLLGLPPTPEEVDAFLLDDSPDAYEKRVDEFLSSKHYGERWGRHWLDLARYADSNGYSIDGPRSIWRYRDWVVDALNQDLTFDRFIIHQLAGDLLEQPSQEALIATGFHRNTQINQEGGIDPEQFRVESVVDRVNTTSTVFLGLTVACAQCHDHKFDPISQKEYYQLFDFFNQDNEPELPVPTPEEAKRSDAFSTQIGLLQNELSDYEQTLREPFQQWSEQLISASRNSLSEEEQTLFAGLDDESDEAKQKTLWEEYLKKDAGYQQRMDAINLIRKQKPNVTQTLVLRKREEARETNIHIQGDFTRKGEEVSAAVPAVLHPLSNASERSDRLDLALWLVSPENPLTARVTVNRVWQRYFGKGIVETENDFGTRGSIPTHPQLLDWLATEFIRYDWSLKKLHRLIVTSSTYRQSSHIRPDLLEIDPYNHLLARQNRIRLDAEIIRDSALTVSGLLQPIIGGPSVYPPQPEGVTKLGQVQRDWNISPGPDRYRRGMYTFFWRATPHPALMVFDAPDANTSCTHRDRSNIPLQALNLLNDPAFFECAVALANRVLMEIKAGDIDRIRHAFRLALGREADLDEIKPLYDFLIEQRKSSIDTPDEAKIVAKWAKETSKASVAENELAAWSMLARVLLNLDEFITRE